jgi:hypothetical protein
MSDVLGSPFFNLHRTIALNPLVPDAADPLITDVDIRETRGFSHAVIYWQASAGVVASDDDTMTVRIIGFDEFQQVWTRIRTVVLRVQERVIVPIVGQRLFVRVDAEATTATQGQIMVAGYSGVVDNPTDYFQMGELPATFAPGGVTGLANTGFLFARVDGGGAGTTELWWEDSAGNLTQITGGGAAGGLQAAYDIDPSIVTTAAVGPLGGPVQIGRLGGIPATEGALQVTDPNTSINRTQPLVLVTDNNDGGAANFATVEIRKNNSTNTGVNLLLTGQDVGALGPITRFFHDSASPANNDVVGRLTYAGRDATPATVDYGRLDVRIGDVTAGAADGVLDIYLRRTGVLARCLIINAATASAQTGVTIQNDLAAGATTAFTFWALNDFLAGQSVFKLIDGGGGAFLWSMNGDGASVHVAGAVGTPSVTTTGDLDTGMFFPAANQVALSTGGVQTVTAATQLVTFTSTSAGVAGVELQFFHNSASPAAADTVGFITFYGNDNGGNKQQYAEIDALILDPVAPGETGVLDYFLMTSQTLGRIGRFAGSTAAGEQGWIFQNFLAAGASNRQFEFRLTENSATVGPIVSIFRNRTNDAVDGDAIGRIDFDGMDDSTPVRATYFRITSHIDDSGVGSMDGHTDWHVQNGGTLGRLFTLRSGTSAAAAEVPTQWESYVAAGATAYQFEMLLTDATATVGPVLSLYRFSSSPAVNDKIGAIVFTGQNDAPAKVEWCRMYAVITQPAVASNTTAGLVFDTTDVGVKNEAMHILSTGAIEIDLSSGAGTATVFDDYDDAMILREAYPMDRKLREESVNRLCEMGVYIRKTPEQGGPSGLMVNVQKMMALLGGGIYQTREKVDELVSENAMLKARLIALEAKS